MACGEGYGTDVLARRARRVTGVDANPEAYEHARLKYTRPGVRFVRDLIETLREPCDAVVFLQTIEHVEDPAAVLGHFRAMCAGGPSTCRPRTCSRWPRPAPRSRTTPGTCASTGRRSSARCARGVFDRVELLGLFHARKLRAHELALRAGWDRVHRALRHHEALLRPLHARHLGARLRAARPSRLDRALDFVAVLR